MPLLVDHDPLVLEWSSSKRPALAVFGGNLVLAWRSDRSHRIHVSVSPDGLQWTPPRKLKVTTSAAPALAEYAGRLYLAWTADDASNRLHVASTTDSVIWTPPDKLPFTSGSAPAMAAFHILGVPVLFLAWRANDDSDSIHTGVSPNPMAAAPTWASIGTPDGFRTAGSPFLAQVDGLLFMAWKTGDDTDRLAVSSTNNGYFWNSTFKLRRTPEGGDARYLYDVPRQLSGDPALLGYAAADVGGAGLGHANPGALLLWSGYDPSRRLNYATSPDNVFSPLYTLWEATSELPRSSPNAAAAAIMGGDVFLAWSANDRSRRLHLLQTNLVT